MLLLTLLAILAGIWLYHPAVWLGRTLVALIGLAFLAHLIARIYHLLEKWQYKSRR